MTATGPAFAPDTTLPRFAVPPELRRWAAEHQIAERRPGRASAMLASTALAAAATIFGAETISTWWAWLVAWMILVAVMMRLDAIHHEAVHRSLYRGRAANDIVASISAALTGFHAPAYRAFHLAHHAVTRQSADPRDPEDFYDRTITSPMRVGPLELPARAAYVLGNLLGGIAFAGQLVADSVATTLGRPPDYVRAATLQAHVRRWGWLPFVLWISAVTITIATGHVGELIRWWVIPMLCFLAGPYTFFALPEHYGAADDRPMVVSTGTVRTNRTYRFVALDGNLHLAHHVFPTASWWWLDAADRELSRYDDLRHDGYLTFHAQVWADMARPRPAPAERVS